MYVCECVWLCIVLSTLRSVVKRHKKRKKHIVDNTNKRALVVLKRRKWKKNKNKNNKKIMKVNKNNYNCRRIINYKYLYLCEVCCCYCGDNFHKCIA